MKRHPGYRLLLLTGILLLAISCREDRIVPETRPSTPPSFLEMVQAYRDGKTYVLGSGKAEPVKNYVSMIRDMMDPSAPLGFGKVPYGDRQVMYLCADISGISADTGWRPSTPFHEGIQTVIKHFCP